MKKLISLFFALIVTTMFSVTAFAGAPVPFGDMDGVINTGGDFKPIVIIAIVAAVLAVVGAVLVMTVGKKKD